MVVFRKFGGFYSAYDDDALILHYLFGYKIKESRVGFPTGSIDKIIDKLNELHINYKVDDKNIVFDDNKYDYYLANSKNRISIDYKIKEIQNKINDLDFNSLNELINIIDNYLNEK